MFGCGCDILLLNVVCKCLVWVEGLCWIDRVWSSKECACCACDHSVHLTVHSIGFVMFLYVGSYLLESWSTCVCSPYVVSLCDFAYYVVG